MNRVLVFAILAAFVVVARSFPSSWRKRASADDSDAASRCSATPTQWFGQFRQIGWDDKKPTELVFRIANASYDSGAGKMKIMDIDVGFNGPKTVTLQDFKGGMQYEVVNGKCTKTSLSGSIPTFGVESNATYETSEYIGSSLPNLGVLVNEYNKIIPDTSIYLSSYAPVTGDVCIPILISDLTVKPGLTMELYYFANLTTTLPRDPFSVPPECS